MYVCVAHLESCSLLLKYSGTCWKMAHNYRSIHTCVLGLPRSQVTFFFSSRTGGREEKKNGLGAKLTIGLLWRLCDLPSSLSQVATQLSSIEYVSTLRGLFCELMVESDKGVESRQLRNDLLMICSRIAQLCPDAPFVVSAKCFFLI